MSVEHVYETIGIEKMKNALPPFMEIPDRDPTAAMARMMEYHAASIEVGDASKTHSPEMSSAIAAVLAAEPASDFRRTHPNLWPAVELARNRRSKLTHVLGKYQIPLTYTPLILLWFFDATAYRYRAEAIQTNLNARIKARKRPTVAAQKFREHMLVSEELRAGLEQRGVATERLVWAIEDLLADWEAEPDRLKYLYFVSSGRGHPKTGQRRELHVVLMNLVGMWKDVNGQLPKIQRNLTKAEMFDQAGEPSPTPFVVLVREIAEALGHRFQIAAVQDAAREVVKELREGYSG